MDISVLGYFYAWLLQELLRSLAEGYSLVIEQLFCADVLTHQNVCVIVLEYRTLFRNSVATCSIKAGLVALICWLRLVFELSNIAEYCNWIFALCDRLQRRTIPTKERISCLFDAQHRRNGWLLLRSLFNHFI